MKPLIPVAALLVSLAIPVVGFAQPRVIGDLSEGALLGSITSTAELQNDFQANGVLIAQASDRLGLSHDDFESVRRAVLSGQARYVEVPRHLTGMAGMHNGVAFAVHDVVIPKHVRGWEVDITKPNGIVKVFVPNRCGNISYLLVPKKQILAAAPPPYHVEEAVPEGPTPPPVASSEVAFVPVIPVVAAAAHHFAILPWLAAGLITAAVSHGGGGVSTKTNPTPIPIHTVCPSPAPVH